MTKERKRAKQAGEHQDGGETRRLILQAAQNLFFTYGYRAVTTRQVADACGITQPALYRHFSDKQDLYVAMLTEATLQLGAALDRIARREISMYERLRFATVYLLNHTKQDITMMLHDMSYEVSAQARATLEHTFMENVVRPLSSIFEDGIRQGMLRSLDQGGVSPATAVLVFLSIVPNFTTPHLDIASSELHTSVAERARMIVELTLHGLVHYELPDTRS